MDNQSDPDGFPRVSETALSGHVITVLLIVCLSFCLYLQILFLGMDLFNSFNSSVIFKSSLMPFERHTP
jgi:hypothetical protein